MPVPDHLKKGGGGQQPQRAFQRPVSQGGGGGQAQRPPPGQQPARGGQPQRAFQQPARTAPAQAQRGGQQFQNQPERRVANPFRGDIASATPSLRGNFWPKGEHRGRIDVVKTIASNQKPGVMFYIVEFIVLASDQRQVIPGQRRSWVADLSKKPTYGDIRKFVACCFETHWEEIDDDICNATCGEEQPLKGFVLDIVCTEIPLRNDPTKMFTKHEFVLVCGPGGEGDDPSVSGDAPDDGSSEPEPDDSEPPPLDDADIPF